MKWEPAPVFLPGKFHGQRSLAGYSPRGCKELESAEHTHTHTHTHTREKRHRVAKTRETKWARESRLLTTFAMDIIPRHMHNLPIV